MYFQPFSWVVGRIYGKSIQKVSPLLVPQREYILFQKNNIAWYALEEDVKKAHTGWSNYIIARPKTSQKIRKKFRKKAQSFNHFIKKISKLSFPPLSNKKLYRRYNKYLLIYEKTYIWGEPPAWFAKIKTTEYLLRYLSTKTKNPHHALHILVTMPELSFLQKEELDLAKLKIKIDNYPPLEDSLITKHTKKWFWIPFDYGVGIWDKNHFQKELTKIKNPNKIIQKIIQEKRSAQVEREELIKSLSINRHHQLIFSAMRDFAYLMDVKKVIFTKSHYYVVPMLKEIAKRLSLSYELSRMLTPYEVKKGLLQGSCVPKSILEGRNKQSVLYLNGRDYQIVPNSIADAFVDFLASLHKETSNQIKGEIGCKGKYTGKVRIINDPRNIHELKKGEILVTPNTSPDFVLGMKKAGAIITDEGGITSHAATVSRELKTPCIIGTKNASLVLKTGMRVVVDADKGIVSVQKK